MRILLPLFFLAGLAAAVEPYVGIGAIQPLASDMHSIYRLMPGASLGVRVPRTGTLAFRVGAAGYLGSGSGDFLREYRLASAQLELGVELRTRSNLGAFVVPAILIGYAAERTPVVDTATHVISDRWDSGTSLGFGLNGGAVLFHSGRFRLDAEAGFRFLSVPTGREQFEYLRYYPYYPSAIEASTFGVGLVARFASPEPD